MDAKVLMRGEIITSPTRFTGHEYERQPEAGALEGVAEGLNKHVALKRLRDHLRVKTGGRREAVELGGYRHELPNFGRGGVDE